MTLKERQNRSEVPKCHTWDLTHIFSSYEQWENELIALQDDVNKITAYKNKLNESADVLYNCLHAYENYSARVDLVYTYASLRINADGSDPNNQNDMLTVSSVMADIHAKLSFIKTEILLIDENRLKHFFAENEKLNKYKKMISDLIEQKSFTLPYEVEEMLSALSDVHDAPYMIYERSKSADMTFEPIVDENVHKLPMSFALYEDQYELSEDTSLRRKAYHSFTKSLNQYKHTYAAIYGTEVKKQVKIARLRGYDSVTKMLLQSQQVTENMYHQQLDVIYNELAPHMRKYALLKKRKLNVDELYVCDLQVSLDPDFQPKTSYEEASELIINALSVMGTEYSDIIKQALKNRWVDRADNMGKTSGAFCASPYLAHPYILITWTNTMRGAFVLAHELGHAGHFYLASKEQSFLNTEPSTYFVEAPSTLNELLLADYLLEQTNDARMKRWIIDQLLGTYFHNFVTHLLEGKLQRRIYSLAEEDTPITEHILTKEKKAILENFWGDAVTIDHGASLTWMRQPHYYMGLYPYTYSAGLTVSTITAEMIKTKGQSAVDQWLDILKTGGTLRPLELISKMGIDMSSDAPVKKAIQYVGSLIDQLEETVD